ncbi:MAG: hypothetical protein GY938_32990, partial [Ketobacter sp.]|nr:hypothetical protein [Ketobacter sp.]
LVSNPVSGKNEIQSSNVVAFGKEHFGCPTFEGWPVEDDGDSGSAGSHWEKTHSGNELMTAQLTSHSVLSPLTLKLMQDSGWYNIDFDQAEKYYWG